MNRHGQENNFRTNYIIQLLINHIDKENIFTKSEAEKATDCHFCV